MYVAAAHLVETLTGQWIGGFVRQRIWEPPRMGTTFYGIDDLKARRGAEDLAQGYRWDKEINGYVEVPWIDQPGQQLPLFVQSQKIVSKSISQDSWTFLLFEQRMVLIH
jgi:CubicO group peptidase (beta-lactamase class C family)